MPFVRMGLPWGDWPFCTRLRTRGLVEEVEGLKMVEVEAVRDKRLISMRCPCRVPGSLDSIEPASPGSTIPVFGTQRAVTPPAGRIQSNLPVQGQNVRRRR